MAESQIKLQIDDDAKKLIDAECRKRGMSRSELMVRATLSFCGASPFTSAEIEAIREIVREEMVAR